MNKILQESKERNTGIELFIQNGKQELLIPVLDGMRLRLERVGAPGRLNFQTFADTKVKFKEGNSVLLVVNGRKIFYGTVFSRTTHGDGLMEVGRWLKNLLIEINKSC